MEKVLKIVKVIAITIIMLLIIAIGFFGVYAKYNGVWNNILPEYNLGMELAGYRELHFELDSSEETKDIFVDENGNYKGDVATGKEEGDTSTEEIATEKNYKIENRTIAANDSDKINIENFEKTQKIIQKRLEKYDSYEYNLRQDSVTGKIILEILDDEDVDLNASIVTTIGKLSLVDTETGVILLDDSNLYKASPFSNTSENGEYQVYLGLEFDQTGKQILKEITEKYTKVTDKDGNDISKNIDVRLDNQTIISTHFQDTISSGTIHVPIGASTTDYSEYLELLNNVKEVSDIINEENMPLQYKVTEQAKIQSIITENVRNNIIIVCAILILVISLYIIIRYKLEGLRQAILNIGYLASLTILFRYTNVAITFNSLIALVGVVVVNYIFAIRFLNELKKVNNRKIALKTTLKGLYLAIVPVVIIAVIFTFMSALVINSVGMTLFWGLLLQLLFSLITLI
ncbi:MAG: hypothetical protein IKL55_00505 [Clostridia bacterium]|nr:hypothetical protein [Clostridia bacterium]